MHTEIVTQNLKNTKANRKHPEKNIENFVFTLHDLNLLRFIQRNFYYIVGHAAIFQYIARDTERSNNTSDLKRIMISPRIGVRKKIDKNSEFAEDLLVQQRWGLSHFYNVKCVEIC